MTRVALFQSTTGIDPERNAETLVAAAAEAANGGAAVLFTPEMSNLLDKDSARARPKLREQDDDPVLAACCDAAREHELWIHVGSLGVLTDGGKVANRSFVIDRNGRVLSWNAAGASSRGATVASRSLATRTT